MTEAQKRAALYNLSLVKYRMLVAYGQGLLKKRTEENAPYINIELGRADLELKLLEGIMSGLRASIPIQFPSDAQVARLRQAAANMDIILKRNSTVNEVIDAADELIDAWPDFQV